MNRAQRRAKTPRPHTRPQTKPDPEPQVSHTAWVEVSLGRTELVWGRITIYDMICTR